MNKVTRNGDLIYWKIEVVNNGAYLETNAKAIDTIPLGLAYVSSSIPKGTVIKSNTNEYTWNIGNIKPGESFIWTLVTKVQDITQAVAIGEDTGFTNNVIITGDNPDPDTLNNTFTQTSLITTCPPSAGAIADPNACLCGNVSINDTPCDHGTTEYRIGTLTNLDPSFTLNVNTGEYNASGKIINPFVSASFTYSIWCIVGATQYETSGPVTVTIPVQFPSTFTDEVTINANGTVTHKSLSGVINTFKQGWTTVISNVSAKTLTFTYPDTTNLVVDISSWFPDTDTTIGNFDTSSGGFIQYDVINVKTGLTTSTVVTTIPASGTVQNVSTFDNTIYAADQTFTVGNILNHIKLNDSGGTILDIVLPDPATLGFPAGQTSEYTFKRVNTSPRAGINFTSSGGKYIDGATSVTMADEPQSSLTFWHDNVNWFRK